MGKEKVNITTDYIKLDQFLKYSGVIGSGSDAKYLIANGHVKVDNQVCTQRGKKIHENQIITIDYEGNTMTFIVVKE